jgi:alpha-1,3-mannosyltransferase
VRIAQVVNHFYPCRGGKESVVKELSQRLKQRGHEVDVVCLNRCADSGSMLAREGNWNGVKIKRVGFLDLHFLKIGFPSVGALRKADVVHAHDLCFLTDFLALTKFLYRKPLVLSTHGGIFHTVSLSVLKKIYFNVWLRLVGGAFDRVIAVSKNDFELFSKIFPAEKMALVENAVDVERLGKIKGNAAANSFLFVGRLSRNKRVDLLLEAFSLLLKKKKGARLTVVGRDFDGILPELKAKAKELGVEDAVRFEGSVSEEKLLQLFSQNAFFVSASNYEGFGISAIEAMAAGLVPVLNSIPSFMDFVDGGKNGFVVDFSKTEEAAGVLTGACSLGKKRLGELSRSARRSVQKFSWEKKADEFEKLYRELKP